MSWAEDFGLDIGLDEIDHEDNWERGVHEDQNGKIWNLEDMKTSHIENCVRFFDERHYDVSKLREELSRREGYK